MNSKDNPGCYHSLIKYLASLEDTDNYKFLEFSNIKQLEHKGKIWPKKSNIVCIVDNIEYPWSDSNTKIRAIDKYKVDKFKLKVLKSIDDFTTKVNNAGNYKDSLGEDGIKLLIDMKLMGYILLIWIVLVLYN